jgi:hypothetical protein
LEHRNFVGLLCRRAARVQQDCILLPCLARTIAFPSVTLSRISEISGSNSTSEGSGHSGFVKKLVPGSLMLKNWFLIMLPSLSVDQFRHQTV